LSNLPAIATDAFTENLMLLCRGVTSKTGAPEPAGACAEVKGENKRDVNKLKVVSRIISHQPGWILFRVGICHRLNSLGREPIECLNSGNYRWFPHWPFVRIAMRRSISF